jgi:hypothetical protein
MWLALIENLQADRRIGEGVWKSAYDVPVFRAGT